MCFALNKGASLIKECAQALQKLEPNLIPVALFEFLTKLYRFLNCKLSLSFSKVIYGMERVCVCLCVFQQILIYRISSNLHLFRENIDIYLLATYFFCTDY